MNYSFFFQYSVQQYQILSKSFKLIDDNQTSTMIML